MSANSIRIGTVEKCIVSGFDALSKMKKKSKPTKIRTLAGELLIRPLVLIHFYDKDLLVDCDTGTCYENGKALSSTQLWIEE